MLGVVATARVYDYTTVYVIDVRSFVKVEMCVPL